LQLETGDFACDISAKMCEPNPGQAMQKKTNPGGTHEGPFTGEFAELLRDIENEAVPERLLELAIKLQAVLLRQRSDPPPGTCSEE
jgi:hypothetical protein